MCRSTKRGFGMRYAGMANCCCTTATPPPEQTGCRSRNAWRHAATEIETQFSSDSVTDTDSRDGDGKGGIHATQCMRVTQTTRCRTSQTRFDVTARKRAINSRTSACFVRDHAFAVESTPYQQECINDTQSHRVDSNDIHAQRMLER